jgi:hypothetical protein
LGDEEVEMTVTPRAEASWIAKTETACAFDENRHRGKKREGPEEERVIGCAAGGGEGGKGVREVGGGGKELVCVLEFF